MKGEDQRLESGQQIIEDKPYRLFCSTRLAIAFLILLCTCLQYSQKIDLSVNIICMVNHSGLAQLSGSHQIEPKHRMRDGPFLWPKPIQGLILSMFFWGYLLSQLPGGILASRFGAKWVMAISMLMNSICLLLYKNAAYSHYMTLMFLRFLVGLGAGVIFPCISQIWTKWAPKQDRSFLIGIAVSGSHLGSVFTLPLAGFLCSDQFSSGWPILFYILGILTFAWVVIWSLVYSNSPVGQRCIRERERSYIIRNLPHESTRKASHSISQKIPWMSIFRSVPCWSQFICHTLLNWGFYTLLTCTPMYMAEILHFDIKSNGGLSSIPYLLIWLATTSSSFIADKLIVSKYATRTAVRKAANLIGSLIPAVLLIGLCFVSAKSAYVGVTLLSLGMAAFGVSFGAGFLCVCNDMSSKYASILFGISNTLGTLPGIISPYLTSRITRNQKPSEWRIVFIVAAVLWVIGGLQFAILGTAEPQQFEKLDSAALETSENEFSKLNKRSASSSNSQSQRRRPFGP